jgi:uncharacterized coiled-coil DUF342 family protein
MLDDKDIQKIINANREVFPAKEDFEAFKEELRKSFSELQTSVDAYAKKADNYFQEMVALSHKVNRHEKWIKQLADKLGVRLEY